MPTSLQLRPIEPVSFVMRDEAFDHPDWIFEPKYEGVRALLYSGPDGCEIRVGRGRHRRFLDLRERIHRVLAGRPAILDGDVVTMDRQRGILAFAAFDLLWLDGRDLRSEPLAERKQGLVHLLPADTGPLFKVLTLDEHGRALFSAVRRLELEGVVAKRRGDAYGSEAVWYRIPNPGYTRADHPAGVFRRQGRSRRSDRSARP